MKPEPLLPRWLLAAGIGSIVLILASLVCLTVALALGF